MFYSETLLSKTGPLARVWLSANLERKLSKSHILQSNIESSVNAIVDQGAAPMALRLSGQLLLGVVRIYSRKARYLLDDCNEALLKIKMAFRPGNVDLPANMNMPSTTALTLEDRISDPILPELDPSLLEFRPQSIDLNAKKDDPMNWNSQLFSDATGIEIGRRESVRESRTDFDEEAMNIDLDLDLGLDGGPSLDLGGKGPSLNMDDLLPIEDGLGNEGIGGQTRASSQVPSLISDRGQDNDQMLFDEDGFNPNDGAFTDPRLRRNSQSPLSSRQPSPNREFEVGNMNEETEISTRRAPHRAKKRKVLQEDSDTTLSSNQIKQQQSDRSAILKPVSFLSRDPFVLNLMASQKGGGFVSSMMTAEGVTGWAPEIRNLLAFDTIKQSRDLKRKRDSGVADVGENDAAEQEDAVPGIIIPDESFGEFRDGPDMSQNQKAGAESPRDQVFLPQEDNLNMGDVDNFDIGRDQFDETTVPLLHPSEQGAISQGTRRAVHLLRERLGGSEEESNTQKKSQITFQDLQPESRSSKAGATKMFFEILVLATKDAVKVDQGVSELGDRIRIRGKRGLWGSWAEQSNEEAEREQLGAALKAAI